MTDERIAVEIDKKCLQRLLDSQQLSVLEFQCADKSSKHWLQKLLLSLTAKRMHLLPTSKATYKTQVNYT